MLTECEALRFDGASGLFEIVKSLVVIEETINVYINGDFYTSLRCIPLKVKELVVGHLLTEGIIKDPEDITDLEVSERNVYVRLSKKVLFNPFRGKQTICGDNIIQPNLAKKIDELKSNKVRFRAEVVFRAVETLDLFSLTHRASRGSHSAALIDKDCDFVSFAEDINRLNALDKVVGDSALKGMSLTKLLLASTGRLTSEMVVKAAQAGIPVLVSLAAPTSLGIKLANALGLTIIGFAERKYFYIYTFPERIEEYK